MKNYQMTPRQYLVQKYCYMRDRVSDPGRSIEGRHYLNLPICTQAEFVSFGLRSRRFAKLFQEYKRSRGNRAKAPSVDRINPTRGYTLDNIQFLSLSDNVSKAKTDLKVVLKSFETGRVYRFLNATKAGSFLGHKRGIRTTRRSFVNLNTGERFLNFNA